ncbi:MAG: calcium-binding protein [Sphingomonadaceae bacterium]|nr:calcium-binding protein [Sphingomonadaceae bacterium]
MARARIRRWLSPFEDPTGGPDSIDGTAGDDTINGLGGNDTINGLFGADELTGGADHDALSGDEGNDSLGGGTGNDTLLGGDDDDELDGGAGDDSADGGEGIDAISADLSSATTSITWILDDNIFAPGFTNYYEGPIGSFTGLEWFATLVTGRANDFIWTLPIDADESIDLGRGDDQAQVYNGEDTVEAGRGADRLSIDYRDSTGVVSNTAGPTSNGALGGVDGAFGDGGTRSVEYTSVETFDVYGGSGGDSILTAGGDDFIRTNGGADMIDGADGNDNIDGGTGDDTMAGGDGGDTLYVDSLGDVVIENPGEGLDFIFTTLAVYSIASLANIENLNGYFNVSQLLTGNARANEISGGLGNDTLDGGAGMDTLYGGDGADELIGGAGIDTAKYFTFSGFRADLRSPGGNTGDAAGDSYSKVENLNGWLGNDTLGGDKRANRLEGLDGADLLNGSKGDDTLAGEAGRDTLKGAAGADSFELASVVAADADTIADFAGGDQIALDSEVFGLPEGGLAAGRLVVGGQAQDANDRLIYDDATGKLFFDSDGTGAADKVLIARLTDAPALSASDFLVI